MYTVTSIFLFITMKRIISFLSLLPLASVFAIDTQESINNDLKFFSDTTCTTLKRNVKNTASFQSDALKNLADKILTGQNKQDYLYAEYQALPLPHRTGQQLRIGDGFSKYDNITGVYLEKGRHVILVGKTEGKEISLLLPNLMRKPAQGIEPTKDPNGWGLHKKQFPLKEGINIIDVETPANAYISYFSDNADKAPKIPVHFVTGKINGYFDTTRGDTNEDWTRLLDQAVSPIMDARGKYIQIAYPIEFLKKFTKGRGSELVNAYDKLVGIQYRLMGLEKYNKTPKNRVFARVNFNYYMFRDGDGVAYLGDNGTMNMVTDPENVLKGDACWGFSHEVGHVMQMRPMTWGGLTEVSNNIFSLQAAAQTGNVSRLKVQNSYDKARKEIIEGNIAYLQSKDVFNMLVPLWQLHLYFSQNGFPDFYPDVMEYLRNKAGYYNGNDTIKYQFEFIKACCDITKTDLTEFFEKWGFFKTGQFHVVDYATYDFTVTSEMVSETKKWIADKGYRKPKNDITTVRE